MRNILETELLNKNILDDDTIKQLDKLKNKIRISKK